jgi:hypothetical protein
MPQVISLLVLAISQGTNLFRKESVHQGLFLLAMWINGAHGRSRMVTVGSFIFEKVRVMTCVTLCVTSRPTPRLALKRAFSGCYEWRIDVSSERIAGL